MFIFSMFKELLSDPLCHSGKCSFLVKFCIFSIIEVKATVFLTGANM